MSLAEDVNTTERRPGRAVTPRFVSSQPVHFANSGIRGVIHEDMCNIEEILGMDERRHDSLLIVPWRESDQIEKVSGDLESVVDGWSELLVTTGGW